MRAYQLPKGGAGIDALTKVERPKPAPGHRQVLVKVAACSLNFRDLGIVRGTYRMPSKENVVPLSDGAGEVIEIGAAVTRVKVGDKVAGNFFARWPGGEPPLDVQSTALGGATDGMLADYAVLEEEASHAGMLVVDITPVSDLVAGDPMQVASDGLHPSGKQYAGWVDLIAPQVREMLKRGR